MSFLQSFELFLNDTVDTEEHAIALAKLLASHFSIRGAHLAVQARLSSQYVSHILTGLSNWLVQKLETAEGKKDKEMTKKVSTLFRALVQLVIGLEPTDALKLCVALII
jgi:cohesin complex subunit SA-1/2